MDSHFQVLVLGTGITESIAAAALSKAGLKVLHVDTNDYYGSDEASLTIKELQKWVGATRKGPNTGTSSASLYGELLQHSRAYSLSLSPSVIVSTGPLISSLIGSGVSRYGGFKLLERICVYSPSGFSSVPGSKEDIFKSKELSLLDKRKLMRFLVFASGDFEKAPEVQERSTMPFTEFLEQVFLLNKQLASALTYALALCNSDSEPVMTALTRIKRYIRSTGRYGPSPFLVGQYGGLGELAQGFCRACAVSGGTYILGHDIISLETSSAQVEGVEAKNSRVHLLKLDELSETLSADMVITSSDLLLKYGGPGGIGPEDRLEDELCACGIVVIEGIISSISAHEDTRSTRQKSDEMRSAAKSLDSAFLVFPPGELVSGAAQGPVNVLINGEGTLSCPRGKSILYFSTILNDNVLSEIKMDPELLLRPYLDETLSMVHTSEYLSPKELSGTFYLKSHRSYPTSVLESLKEQGVLVCPGLPTHFSECGDAAAINAESLYRDVLERLGGRDSKTEFWPPLLEDLDNSA
ncbi:hypothetical protein M0805_007895 [Coniferiporia weirii]|nr:hypothetical protein M0805_007895 [Coniferiporia weirii]